MGANRSARKSALRQAAAILLLASALGLAVGALRGTLSLRPPAGAPAAEGSASQAEGLTPREAQRLLAAGATPLDARRPEDFATGHLPGALNLPVEEFDLYFPRIQPRLDRATPLVVYCGGGECTLSHELAQALRPMGFRVKILRGGLEAWKAAGLGVER
jgi:rhodanese-related sulfurtransferase